MVRTLLTMLICSWLAAQSVPRVVSLTPANMSDSVAPATTELVAVFDQDMNRSGHSICNGAKAFPKFRAKPQWRSARELVLTVELKPDTEYALILNCSSARNFRSAAGQVLPRVDWRFTTLPAKERPIAEQRVRNALAFSKLGELLDSRYSYRDRLIKDWAALRQQHREELVGVRTDRAFAVAAAKMLAGARDMHLSLRYRETEVPTYSPLVEPLYRTFAVRRVFTLDAISPRAFRAETKDGIGYLLITGWQDNVDPERLVGAITEMMEAKALILDVRMNTGGDERIARRIASWFVKGTHVYAGSRARIGPGDDGFGAIEESKIVGHEVAYDRPVAVLAGPRVMSANESFLLMMKKAFDVTIVGQKTAGSSGNSQPYDLGNGVTIMIPSWQALRPDGSCWEGEGIAPDVFVPCTSRDFRDRDPTLDKALELLRARVAKGK